MLNRTLLLCAAAVALVGARRAQPERLKIDEARAYMVELINRDRAAAHLPAVTLDATATTAGQKHAEEMATHQYMAHWNLAGKLPDQRYTEGGGTDYVQENVYLKLRYHGTEPSGELAVDPSPTFTRKEIEEIEAAYINEIPPDDGHRRAILDPHHNRVGVSLARAISPSGEALANTQEFVNRYVEADPIPQKAAPGTRLQVGGKLLPGASLRAVSLCRGPLPDPMSVPELRRTRSYHTPRDFVSYYPEPYESPRPVRIGRDGRFSVEVSLSDQRQPGLYYVSVWVRGTDGRDFIASQRTVLVQDTSAPARGAEQPR